MAINFNNLINPVGSVQYTIEKTQPNGTKRKAQGLAKRTGEFSADNPYYQQIQLGISTGNYKAEDIAAMWERAVDWEANLSLWQKQLEVDYAIKQEDREYNLPENEVQRLREAGINPDLQGSGAGSSIGGKSGTQAGATLNDAEGSVGFYDPVVQKQLTMQGIETAASVLNTLSSSFNQIAGGISTLQTTPSQIKINEAQAGLIDAQANDINSMLEGKISGQKLQNVRSYYSGLADISQTLVPESTDEEIIELLGGLGYSEKQIPHALKAIRKFHEEPNLLTKFEEGKLSHLQAQVNNSVYSRDVIQQVTEGTLRNNLKALELEYSRNDLQSKISNLLNTNDFASKSAGLTQSQVGNQQAMINLSQDEIRLKRKQLEADVEAHVKTIKARQDEVVKLKKEQQSLLDKCKSQNREMTSEEKATYDALNSEIIQLEGLVTSEYNKLSQITMNAAWTVYQSNVRINEEGELNGQFRMSHPNKFSDALFNMKVTDEKTPRDFAVEIGKVIFGEATSLVGAVIGKGKK